jgi:uncharacterized membrane protein
MHAYEIEIDRPVSDVYQQFSNQDNLPRWITGLQRIEQLEGTPGEVGSISKHIYLEKGRVIEMIETITAHEPEKRFTGELTTDGMQCTIHVDFVDKGDRTLMRFRSDFRSQGLVMKLMMPFMKGHIRARQEGDVQKFKALVEGRK